MCGICGFWTEGQERERARSSVSGMIEALRHRGRDDSGLLVDQTRSRSDAGGTIALGHARLSIIDLEGGHQPIFNEDRSKAVICNGEIYNYRALRSELEARGHHFRTRSDSEVIVHLWEEEGERCVHRLRGMFSFVVWDRERNCLFGARDRFGQKFLHYYSDGNGCFAFASEIKGLLAFDRIPRRVDLTALDQFLFYQFVPHPRTLFEGIRQVPPGSAFLYDGERLTITRYFTPQISRRRSEPFSQSSEETSRILAHLEEKLLETVEIHLASDLPVGGFLSGGIDSSLVLAMAARFSRDRMRTFSIGFPGDQRDESAHARAAAAYIGTDHEEIPFIPGNVPERMAELTKTFDQPIADPAALPLGLLSERAGREVKVVLTGDGGDELFAGYGKYQKGTRRTGFFESTRLLFPHLFSPDRLAAVRPDPTGLRKLRARLAVKRIAGFDCVYYKNFWEGWERHALYRPEIRNALAPGFESLANRFDHAQDDDLHPVDRMLFVDQLGYLPDDLLLKTDLATMAHGLEARAPLLDHELAVLAAELPLCLMTTPDETKVALRRIAERWIPAELVKRPKQGFSVPIASWFRGELRDWTRNLLLNNARAIPDYFCTKRVSEVLDEHAAGRRNHASRIYTLVIFELWHQHHIS